MNEKEDEQNNQYRDRNDANRSEIAEKIKFSLIQFHENHDAPRPQPPCPSPPSVSSSHLASHAPLVRLFLGLWRLVGLARLVGLCA